MPYLPFATKTDNHFNKRKLVGVYIENEVSNYLFLYALSKNLNVSEILRELILLYIKNKPSEEKLLFEIAKEAHEEWKKWVFRNSGLHGWRTHEQISNRWNDFKKEAQKNLKKRKIPQEIITTIIDTMENIEIGLIKENKDEA